jgi:hypothetical protein
MKNTITWVLVIVIVAAAVVLGMTYLKGGNVMSVGTASASDYQAVFLVNGQVYFGQLAGQGNQFMSLTDVYYLQVNQALQPADEETTQAPDISLVKLGGELHGPTDEMLINRDQVLLIEDLKTDSNVVRAIKEYKDAAAKAPVAPVAPAPAN